MRKNVNILLAVFSFLLLLTGAAGAAGSIGLGPEELALQRMEGHYYFLGYNLHADLVYNKVSSVNYQLRGELVPWGTEVRITRVQGRRLIFEDVAKHRRYSYEFHWKNKYSVALADHLDRVFLESVDDLKSRVAGLSEIDKDGIYEGRVKPGMSREGVLVAIGYPPEFANHEELMTDRDWLYWVSRHGKMVVSFGRDGLVSQISGDY